MSAATWAPGEPAGTVELVALALAFNKLTGRLRSLVQHRIGGAALANWKHAEQLATLNRFTGGRHGSHAGKRSGHHRREMDNLLNIDLPVCSLNGGTPNWS
jgi:hypothetical protein